MVSRHVGDRISYIKNNVGKQEILGVKFDNLDKDEVLEKIKGFLKSKKQHYIVLPYSEFLVRAKRDQKFREILNSADLCIAEGMGPVIASRILGKPLKGRITGIELIKALYDEGVRPHKLRGSDPLKVFLFGARKGVTEEAVRRLEKGGQTPLRGSDPLKFVGIAHGENYKDPVRHSEIIDTINQANPQILFVALGSPKQEEWIVENLSKLPSVKVAIGVGGAFDFISGRAKRAPEIMQNIGLEWVWRFARDPKRFPRIINATAFFPSLVFSELFKNKLKK